MGVKFQAMLLTGDKFLVDFPVGRKLHRVCDMIYFQGNFVNNPIFIRGRVDTTALVFFRY